jgi:hypothetical protein
VRASYRSDLTAITLDESSNSSWIMALKAGRYAHPIFGEIVINHDRAERFVFNEVRKVRRIDMDIDYDHKRRRDDAAGWVKNVENREGDIWYFVEWTDEAAAKIRNREYKYFSSEFADEWTDPETGTTHQDVLFGGGLTNRPFIKGMVPVNLSESEAEQARLAEETSLPTGREGATEGGNVSLDLTAIRKALKLSEGTSDEDTLTAVVAKLTEAPAPAPEVDGIKELAETNPLVAKMLADQQESAKRLAEMESAMRLSEVRTALHDVDADTTTAITPATKELAQPLLLKLPAKERNEFLAVLRQFAEGKGTVTLGETGGTSPATRTDDGHDPVKKFTDLVKSIEKEDGLAYRDALRVATQRDPRLFDAYHEATTAFKVVAS